MDSDAESLCSVPDYQSKRNPAGLSLFGLCRVIGDKATDASQFSSSCAMNICKQYRGPIRRPWPVLYCVMLFAWQQEPLDKLRAV